MGEVFLAAKPGPVGFGPYVALKVLRDELACDPQFVDMLVDEANISMFLNHQNVVTVLDLGEDDGSYYIAMEYVQGITVERLVESLASRGKKLAIPVALYMGTELCRALKYAHTRVNHAGEPLNIVHRDVTPANILLSVQGEVKLTDFGIARAKGRIHQTQAGVLKGKFGYMAPEMVRYERIDARADLFCAGVVLYLMLAGQHPVAGAAVMEAIQKYEDKRIAPPSTINPAIPHALDAIVMRCLEPKVEHRWNTAAELGDALQDVLLKDAHWRTAAKDGARLVAQQIRDVAPEAFDVPVSAEQLRHLLERARAERGQRPGGAPLGRDRLGKLGIPAGPRGDTSTDDNLDSTSESGGVMALRPPTAGAELDLPTATSLPAITPDMDFAPTPAVSQDQETDEQLELDRVKRALEPDTDEQEPGESSDTGELSETGAVPSAPADATAANPVVSAPRGGHGSGRPQAGLLEEPALPDAGSGGYAVAPGDAAAEATVAQFHYGYEEEPIDRELAPSTGEDGATVVSPPGADFGGLDAWQSFGLPAGDDVVGAPTLAGPPGVMVGHDDPDAATIIPTGPEFGMHADRIAKEWQPPADDAQDATLLDGLATHDVQAALAAAPEPMLYNRLGVIRAMRRADFEGALTCLEAAVAAAPEHRAYVHNLQKVRHALARRAGARPEAPAPFWRRLLSPRS
ncbi:MAG: protein kinase [Myxococcales bacterium]|nr:protein kinase [Myxococcales bacterium]